MRHSITQVHNLGYVAELLRRLVSTTPRKDNPEVLNGREGFFRAYNRVYRRNMENHESH